MFGDLEISKEARGFAQNVIGALNGRFLRRSKPSPSVEIELDANIVGLNVSSNAVVVRNAFKSYGRVKVLEDFNMTVPKGSIYGLLGASGCGKTTLLNCLNGRKVLNSGDVYVLGSKTPNFAMIGYMPQNTGLYGDLTARETFLFFGRVIGMDENTISERSEYLVQLLMIPSQDLYVKDMSGGEQRRISLAVGLLHEPELLILDEPTVGVDSVLRQLIWEHFTRITADTKVTIIITTHYIEETGKATLVGLMRGGRLMAEAAPQELLKMHGSSTLEAVFLKLSVLQNQHRPSVTSGPPTSTVRTKEGYTINRKHLKALVMKNLLWMRKNWSTSVNCIMLALASLTIFCVGVGHNPTYFPISIVNLEANPRICMNHSLHCDSAQLSCSLLDLLAQRKIDMTFYSSKHEAIESVVIGKSYAAIAIKPNYSSALRARVSDWRHPNDDEIDRTTIEVFRDNSNFHISLYIQMTLYQILEEFISTFLNKCGSQVKAATIPIQFEPIYYWTGMDYTNYTLPGFLLLIIFITAIMYTSMSMHPEQNAALMERLLVSGINRVELVVSYVISNSVLLVLLTGSSMILVFPILKMVAHGSLVLVTMMVFITSFSGVCYGMFVACLSDSQLAISYIAGGTSIAMSFLSGVIWPIEAIHWLLKPLSSFFPITQSILGLRGILYKDYNMLQRQVYLGFLSALMWSISMLLLCIIVIRLRRY